MWALWARASTSAAQGLSLFGQVAAASTSVAAAAPSYLHQRGFKVVSSLRRRCRECRVVKRGKKIYVLCETNPRHKQRQGKGGSRYQTS